MMELHEDIHALLQNPSASLDDLKDAWERLYGCSLQHEPLYGCSLQHEPKSCSHSSLTPCVNALACFAVHYGSKLVNDLIWDTQFCDIDPFITGIYEKKMDWLRLHFKPEMYRSDNPCKRGYGIIVRNKLILQEDRSVMDAIFASDVVEVLPDCLEMYNGLLIVLAEIARRYKATKCLKLILHETHKRSALSINGQWRVYKTESLSDERELFADNPSPWQLVKLLHKVVSFCIGCPRDVRIVNRMHMVNAVYVWIFLCKDIPQENALGVKRFLSSAEESAIKRFASAAGICSNTSYTQPALVTYGSPVVTNNYPQLSVDLLHNIIQDSCSVLLYKISNNAEHVLVGSQGVVSETFHYLQDKVYSMFGHYGVDMEKDMKTYHRALKLMNGVIKMFLQYGCVGAPQHEVVNRLFRCQRRLNLWTMFHPPSAALKQFLQYGHEYVMILLAYGYAKQTVRSQEYTSFFATQQIFPVSKSETITVNMCVSLMSHEAYELYKEAMARLDKSKKSHDKDKQQATIDWTTASHCDVAASRSLKQLCRIKLFDLAPNGNMVQYVQQLEVSDTQRYYLSLGVEPL